MIRIDDDAVAVHLEAALLVAAAGMLADLRHSDRYRRIAAISTLSRYLADRLRCLEISTEDKSPVDHPSLFAELGQ